MNTCPYKKCRKHARCRRCLADADLKFVAPLVPTRPWWKRLLGR